MALLARMAEEDEGALILKLLTEKGLSVQDLAKAVDVTWSAAKKYIQTEKLGLKARQSCARGLAKLGIDPRIVWPNVSPDGESQLPKLKAIARRIPKELILDINRLLIAERGDQFRIIDFLEGRLIEPVDDDD